MESTGQNNGPNSRLNNKRELRTRLNQLRKSQDAEYRRAADARILERVSGLLVSERFLCRGDGVLFCYVSSDEEVDTRLLIRRMLTAGRRVAVPRCRPGSYGIMDACEIRSMEELRLASFGIPEPGEGCLVVKPSDLYLCVVPCISVNPDTGARLGYGGGYYDRYLMLTDAPGVVLCREQSLCRLIREESHDCPADVLITESRVILYERDSRGARIPREMVEFPQGDLTNTASYDITSAL